MVSIETPSHERRLEVFSLKSLLDVACDMDIPSPKLRVKERAKEKLIDLPVFLGRQCHGNAREQNLAHFFSPELFQALQMEGLKQKNENPLHHFTALVPNLIFVTNVSQLQCGLPACLKHPKTDILEVEISKLKLVAKLCVEQVVEQEKEVLIVKSGSGIGVHITVLINRKEK